MPVYEYLCNSCGPFSDMRPMAECELPQDCPDCGTVAPRVILTAPSYFGMSTERRLAHATNERSSHAPKSSKDMKSGHGAGCSCCSGTSSRLVKHEKNGAQSFSTSRPWMISH